MTAQPAVLDLDIPSLSISGGIIKRDAWNALRDASNLLERAESIRRGARDELDRRLEDAHRQGLEAGRVEGLAQMASELLRVQNETRALLARERARIADLACAVVSRVAPRLAASDLVPALVLEAVREMQAEQFLQVRVHPDSLAHVEATVGSMRELHPGVSQIQVVADADLAPLGCVLVSEGGKVEAGLDEQLAALGAALRRAAATGEDA